jgi:hypothetical protein
MNKLEGWMPDDEASLGTGEPGWTVGDLTRALAPDPAALSSPERCRRGKSVPATPEGSAFTLGDAHRYDWVEVGSCPRPGYTIIVYRAGPGFLVRKKFRDGDLLHLRVCSTRTQVCRYLVEKMDALWFAKFVWGFLAKVA